MNARARACLKYINMSLSAACVCLQNGFVECQKERCLGQDGCYMLLDESKDGCCHKCKGELCNFSILFKAAFMIYHAIKTGFHMCARVRACAQ